MAAKLTDFILLSRQLSYRNVDRVPPPGNTQKARGTAINSFVTFLATEGMAMAEARRLIDEDTTGKILRIILDKYAYRLVARPKRFSRHTVQTYYGNVKNWLMKDYPVQSSRVGVKLQEILSTVGKFCSNHEDETGDNQAPPCSNPDLEAIVRVLYSTASTESDYLDASLAVMTWYLYGRSSDVERIEKKQLTIRPGKPSRYVVQVNIN
jgi:hypothetical protein